METIPKIYAQVSDSNDRLLSLLSSVLMRKMRQSNFEAIRNDFPSSFGSTTVALVLITASDTLKQLLRQATEHTCLHLLEVDVAKPNSKERFKSLLQFIDRTIPIFLVTDGDFPWLHDLPPVFESRHYSFSIHFVRSKWPTFDSRIVVLTNEQHMSSSQFPDTICVVVAPGTATEFWKTRLVLKYIQAIAYVRDLHRSKL